MELRSLACLLTLANLVAYLHCSSRERRGLPAAWYVREKRPLSSQVVECTSDRCSYVSENCLCLRSTCLQSHSSWCTARMMIKVFFSFTRQNHCMHLTALSWSLRQISEIFRTPWPTENKAHAVLPLAVQISKNTRFLKAVQLTVESLHMYSNNIRSHLLAALSGQVAAPSGTIYCVDYLGVCMMC